MCAVPAGPRMGGLSPFGPERNTLVLPSTVACPSGASTRPSGRLIAEAGGFEIERCEDTLGDELLPGAAGDAFDHRSGNDVVHVRVGERAARMRDERLRAPLAHQPVAHLVQVAVLRVGFYDQLVERLVVARHSAGVREQLRQRHAARPRPCARRAPEIPRRPSYPSAACSLRPASRRAARSSLSCRSRDESGR